MISVAVGHKNKTQHKTAQNTRNLWLLIAGRTDALFNATVTVSVRQQPLGQTEIDMDNGDCWETKQHGGDWR